MNFFKDERPDGWPELVEPSLSKQDMLKFFGLMPPWQSGFWDKVLENAEDLLFKGSAKNWPLNSLTNPRGPNAVGARANEKIPDGIAQIREKVTAPLEEVSKF